MKLGIVTFHRAVNPGAFLQAYALQRTLTALGHTAALVNHRAPGLLRRELYSALRRHKGLMRLQGMAVVAYYHRLQNKYLPMAEPGGSNGKGWPAYDGLVFGSDELWNFRNFFYGLNPMLFGHGIAGPRLVSYAPSFGEVAPDEDIPALVGEGLRGFHAIGVRDRNAQDVVERIVGKRPELVADPTLLYDFEAERPAPLGDGKTLVVYATRVDAQRRAQLREIARREGLTIVSLAVLQDWVDRNYGMITPFEVLSRFAGAKYVYTNTFHGTIFALKTGRPVAIEVARGKGNKIGTLSELFQLDDWIAAPERGVEQILKNPAPADGWRQRELELRAKSLEYLRGALA